MRNNRLVVIPSDPIAAYEQKGTASWLERYYNPGGYFAEVFAVSPLEEGERRAYGMTILGASEEQFRGVIEGIAPDVVRAYGGYRAADLACLHRLPGVPVVVSVHDTNPALLHPSVRYADLVICVSEAVKRCVMRIGVPASRIRLLPNRVDTALFSPVTNQERLRVLDARFPPGKHLLHIGRKEEQKNLDTVIRALGHLPREYQCVFIGQGDCAPYRELARSIGVDSRCYWVPSVPNDELPRWYSWCDCLCTPSRWEGFGVVFIEAAACGAAIVTSDIAPMNEFLTADISARLVQEYEDPAVLAIAVRQVVEDTAYREQITRGAREVAQQFDRRIIDAREVAIYQEALQLSPPAQRR